MRQLSFLLTGLVFILTVDCSKQRDISEEEIYTVINQIISDDSLRFYDLNKYFSEIPLTEDCFKVFNKNDLGFVLKQFKVHRRLAIKNEILKEYWPRDKKYHMIIIDSASNNFISIPLISKDRQKVLINISSQVGQLGGQVATYLYLKINGKWIRKKTINNWIS